MADALDVIEQSGERRPVSLQRFLANRRLLLVMDNFDAVDVKGEPAVYPAELTRRKVEVLRLVAQGMTDIQVAAAPVISPRTVNAHLTSIYSKLGVNSRTAATRFAIENGLD